VIRKGVIGFKIKMACVKTTTVVHVGVANIRPRYHDLREWMNDSDTNVYIGRKGIVFIDNQRFPHNDSFWANPYAMNKQADDIAIERRRVLDLYRQHLVQMEQSMGKQAYRERLLNELEGHQLGCWCSPLPCHGDILRREIQRVKQWVGKIQHQYNE
jgi:Domain of unknown function (DUF4326)